MKLSLVIPAHNEADCIEKTILGLVYHLRRAAIPSEILVVNDNSTDATGVTLKRLSAEYPEVTSIDNLGSKGFGFAVRRGLENFTGDVVAIVMGDGSDAPEDVVRFFRKIGEGYDCVFGSRFVKGGTAHGYPLHKLILNRVINQWIRLIFGIKYNDVTNAFKMYHQETIQGLRPFLSDHFNLTVELPLKAITRGYSYTVLPNSWTNRKSGKSKLKIKEMGSRYLFIVLYCLIEKWLSLGDYKKDSPH